MTKSDSRRHVEACGGVWRGVEGIVLREGWLEGMGRKMEVTATATTDDDGDGEELFSLKKRRTCRRLRVAFRCAKPADIRMYFRTVDYTSIVLKL